MPTPLPAAAEMLDTSPDEHEVLHIARGVVAACRAPSGTTRLQSTVLGALIQMMTSVPVDIDTLEDIDAAAFAEGLARRDEAFRGRLVQIMELGHMILPTPSVEVADRVIDFATELCVDHEGIHIARQVAHGSRQLVAADFDRSEYLMSLDLSEFTSARTDDEKAWAWTHTATYEALADKWRSLGSLEAGTLGRSVHNFYEARGFRVPGEPGSAPPLLAQHDWVHVLADYGSTVESELEVFAFIASASDDPKAFSLLAMVINLFQTGQLESAAGIFEADVGHLEENGMPERLADALRRGAQCHGGVDFLAMDYWSIADQPVTELRTRLGVTAKSAEAVDAGSVGPWQPGGISPFQSAAGQELASERGRDYDSHGAAVL